MRELDRVTADEGSKPSPEPPISVGQRAVRTARPVPTEVDVLPRLSIALATALLVAASTVAQARPAAFCGPRGYAYAGVQSGRNGHGIAAVLTALTTPKVTSGHVAGWIGVGAPGEGPGRSDAWIQVGLNGTPGSGNTLYYEVVRADTYWKYKEIVDDVPTGRPFRVAVLETSAVPGAWRVWVDGHPVTEPIWLGSGARLTPMALGESWDGGQPACNSYSYRFAGVSIATARGGSWQPTPESTVVEDPGYQVIRRTPSTFDAAAAATPPSQPRRSTGGRANVSVVRMRH
jgi:hypothetical protein